MLELLAWPMTNIHPRLTSQPSSAMALTTLISDAGLTLGEV